MTVTYEVVEHDGGWAYRMTDVYSETFPTHERALAAARNAAQRQHLEGATASISFQDQSGQWHTEVAKGGDRPETEVVDRADEKRREEPPASVASSNSPAEPE